MILTMIKRLSKCIREYKLPSILAPIFISFEVILEVFIPKIMGLLIDNGIEKNTISAYDLKKIGEHKYLITTTQKIKKGCDVNLIVDEQAEKELMSQVKKVPIKINVVANENQNLTVQYQ